MRIFSDERGSLFVFSYIVLYVLLTLSVGVVMFNSREQSFSRRFLGERKAFWLAEAGLKRYMNHPDILKQDDESLHIDLGPGMVILTHDDSDPEHRVVTAKGLSGEYSSRLQMTFPQLPPLAFRNTISSNGHLVLQGQKSVLFAQDKVQLAGRMKDQSNISNILIEDLREGAVKENVEVFYPDANGNGKKNEFEDFKLINRKMLANYPSDEILYLSGNSTYTLSPKTNVRGKKIIYVEGSEGQGDVQIQFQLPLEEKQVLTIISTGTVRFNQAGKMPAYSQLNIIAWEGYVESSAVPSTHNGYIFTPGYARFDEIHDTSVTNGSVVAGKGVIIGEIWASKVLNYRDLTVNDKLPAGFEGLQGGGNRGYSASPDGWMEAGL